MPRTTSPAMVLLAATAFAAVLLIGGCGSAAAGGTGGSLVPRGTLQTAVAGRTATAMLAATAEAQAEAERGRAEATALALRRATANAEIAVVQTVSAGRAQRQTATAAAPATTAAPATPASTPVAAAAPTQGGEPAQLRFVKLNEDDDPACISVAVRGVATAGWSFRVDGTRSGGRFDRAGNARVCGLGRRQEVTLTVFNGRGEAVRGGQGVPSRGSAIMQATWR